MVTVVVADDHPVYRDGIVRALLDTGRYRIEAEASDGSTAAELIEARRPDVALLDLGMPGLDGLAVLHRLRRGGVGVPVVMLTAFPHAELADQALAGGAAVLIGKDCSREEIVAALDAAYGLVVDSVNVTVRE
ncbi:response regulator [Candidatus Solirubrobacter pratensis]|uniref:response regulator n=1 Tax=Candidatus Solirubrobacter pratensis TaxID=1298857 RepID=UPI0004218161|nr:response regulator transcription factor [Candidatus Solirubrobacter pratensis]